MRINNRTIIFTIAILLLITCSKDKNGDFYPDTTKNALYIDGKEYPLAMGIAEHYSQPPFSSFDYGFILFSSGISYDEEDFSGTGNFIMFEITCESWKGPEGGTYSADLEEDDPGFMEFACAIDFNTATWQVSQYFESTTGTLTLLKNGNEYELTLIASGEEYIDEEVARNNVSISAHYKGEMIEVDFLSEDPATCKFDADTIDFSFGIDYDHPEKYLVPGEESDLSDENLEEVISAIGTPAQSINGIRQVCHWVNQNFNFSDAGGTMAGVNTVDELFDSKVFYGCHSQSLIISSILRKFGFPTVMIETAAVQWAYDEYNGDAHYMQGHVMTEVFVNSKWILLDNNCTYVENYDHLNPYIPWMMSEGQGLFVFAKGKDIWDYTDGDDSFTHTNMMYFSDNILCYEDLFFTVDYHWAY